MPPMTVVFRGTRADLRRALAAVPTTLAGRGRDTVGAALGVQLRLSTAVLSQVHQDFLTKSRGGVGKDGVKWTPLDPKTVAGRKRTAKESAALKKRRKAGEKLTALGYYGSRVVDVLRDTARLLRSLTPGTDGRAFNPDQIVRTPPGEVIVGTNVPYAGAHQNGTKYIPARPFLPVRGRIPLAYMPAIGLAAARGVARAVVLLLGGRPYLWIPGSGTLILLPRELFA
ncbi:MAG TPA: hypothetical protein VD866_13695 [Urbifossiella sp.]|nr:hypothetical protein [Urbifossiella sp.]